MSTSMLTVAVTLLGVVLAAQFLLTLAVIRRLRQVEESHQYQSTPQASLPEPGSRVGQFTAAALDGGTVSERDFAAGHALAVFLMPGCAPCKDVLAALRSSSPETERVFAFIAGTHDQSGAAEILDALPAHARPVLAPAGPGGASSAFMVSSYPAVVNVLDGAVVFASNRLAAEAAA